MMSTSLIAAAISGSVEFALDALDMRDAMGRGDDDVIRSGLRVPPGVLARMVNLKAVRVVLDRRHAVAARLEFADELFQQRGLAGVGLADDGEDRDHSSPIKVLASFLHDSLNL